MGTSNDFRHNEGTMAQWTPTKARDAFISMKQLSLILVCFSCTHSTLSPVTDVIQAGTTQLTAHIGK